MACLRVCWVLLAWLFFSAAPFIVIGPLATIPGWAGTESNADDGSFIQSASRRRHSYKSCVVTGTVSWQARVGLFKQCRGFPCPREVCDCVTYSCESAISGFGVLLCIAWPLATIASFFSPVMCRIMACDSISYQAQMTARFEYYKARSAQRGYELNERSFFGRVWACLRRPYFSVLSWIMFSVGVTGSTVNALQAADSEGNRWDGQYVDPGGAHMCWGSYVAIGVCVWHGVAMISHLIDAHQSSAQQEHDASMGDALCNQDDAYVRLGDY